MAVTRASGHPKDGLIRRVVVGVDGSRDSMRALGWVRQKPGCEKPDWRWFTLTHTGTSFFGRLSILQRRNGQSSTPR